jgi:hypothetical protein
MLVMRFISAILITLTIFTIGNAQKVGAPSGSVRGTIFDSNEAVVQNVKVYFESDTLKRETVTNDEGDYKIELPVGVYQVTTNSIGFCTSQRAPFRVQASSDNLINLTLVVCPLANIFTLDKDNKIVGEECRYIDPFQSESFQISKASDATLNLLVRYGNRQEKENVVEYQGAEVKNGVPSGVFVNYDVLTIVAEKVRFNKKTLLLEASGNIVVEDGKRRRILTDVKIDFSVKDPIALIQKQ